MVLRVDHKRRKGLSGKPRDRPKGKGNGEKRLKPFKREPGSPIVINGDSGEDGGRGEGEEEEEEAIVISPVRRSPRGHGGGPPPPSAGAADLMACS